MGSGLKANGRSVFGVGGGRRPHPTSVPGFVRRAHPLMGQRQRAPTDPQGTARRCGRPWVQRRTRHPRPGPKKRPPRCRECGPQGSRDAVRRAAKGTRGTPAFVAPGVRGTRRPTSMGGPPLRSRATGDRHRTEAPGPARSPSLHRRMTGRRAPATSRRHAAPPCGRPAPRPGLPATATPRRRTTPPPRLRHAAQGGGGVELGPEVRRPVDQLHPRSLNGGRARLNGGAR